MALYDWNKDLIDDAIEFNIYKSSMDNRNNYKKYNTASSSSAGEFWIVFLIRCVIAFFNQLIAAIILLIYGLIKWIG